MLRIVCFCIQYTLVDTRCSSNLILHEPKYRLWIINTSVEYIAFLSGFLLRLYFRRFSVYCPWNNNVTWEQFESYILSVRPMGIIHCLNLVISVRWKERQAGHRKLNVCILTKGPWRGGRWGFWPWTKCHLVPAPTPLQAIRKGAALGLPCDQDPRKCIVNGSSIYRPLLYKGLNYNKNLHSYLIDFNTVCWEIKFVPDKELHCQSGIF